MFGPRRMMRRAMRMAGGGQQRVREAQALMAQGRFEDAARLFSQLSGEAAQRGMIRPAGYLAMQAARAYAQAGKGDEALAQAKRALDIMLNAGNPMQAARAMPRAITFLRGHGFAAQANALEDEAWALATLQQLRAIVVTSDWAMSNADAASLIEIVRGRVPTLTFVKGETLGEYGQQIVFDKVYWPALHEFCTVPFDLKEFTTRLNRALKAAKQSRNYLPKNGSSITKSP
jgi:tetratricopeptide (TPR) repeat protein